VNQPIAAMAAGFDSIWVASGKDKVIVRIDAKTNAVTATVPVRIADSEGSLRRAKAASGRSPIRKASLTHRPRGPTKSSPRLR